MRASEWARMGRVTGIGGIFLRARDPEAMGAWYERHLGLPCSGGFAQLNWSDDGDPKGFSIWAAFENETTYFGATTQQAMVNFRVDNLDELLAKLAADGVEIVPERNDEAHGRFAWIVDCEGNRVELWEPEGRRKD